MKNNINTAAATGKSLSGLPLEGFDYEALSLVFNKSSRFGRLHSIECALAGKNLYSRFSCSTGDAMGMNMVSRGVQDVIDFLYNKYFPDMDVIGISGNYCSDKKTVVVNWIEGRGKSIVCEVIIKEEVVNKVLKTNVASFVELNMLKKFSGAASNIVSAVFIAMGQDPAQNIESSHCITMMEAVNGGKDLHVSVTMPSIECGTVGSDTRLASQSACLNLLGVKGASKEPAPGPNARLLASIVAGSVLAGELSLMSAIAAGQHPLLVLATKQPSVVAMGIEYSLSSNKSGPAMPTGICTYPTGISQHCPNMASYIVEPLE